MEMQMQWGIYKRMQPLSHSVLQAFDTRLKHKDLWETALFGPMMSGLSSEGDLWLE